MKRRKTAAAAVLAFTLLTGGILGLAALPEQSVFSRFQTGGVSIELESKMVEGGTKKKFTVPGNVVPGQRISMIPRVINRAEECYVRAEIKIHGEFQNTRVIDTKDFYGMEPGWVRQEKYFYYTRPLKHGQAADLYQGLQVPGDWSETDASEFRVEITAEAIQAENLNPDFDSGSPWGSIETEVSQIGENYRTGVSKKTDKRGINLVYQGGAKTIAADGDSFMSRLDRLMPGDIYSDTMKLRNPEKKKVRIYFKATAEDSSLLRRMQLTIRSGDELFYKGPMTCGDLSDYRLLAELVPGGVRDISFTVSVPEDLRNPYQVLRDQVTWCFMAQDTEGNPVQTGDDTGLFAAAFIMLLTAGGIIALVFSNRGRRLWQ
ncbi:hypothetical protein NE619_01225 [Anaerovorax odorimutans]|uniref:Uncharacterized protein n=1 Tax=Anaerovorax odorimutans TaxID=109327 RepID=A0ABT1RJI3_9FIRM|nr:hypothetical protein [Anaerovorax odorimutans]MCQ4635337.1 hypothetical protein [Anaerovorax odorimutans]